MKFLFWSTLSIVVCTPALAPLSAQPVGVATLEVHEEPPGEREIKVTVRNGGTRTITAWGISAHISFSDGVSRELGVSTDGYEDIAARRAPQTTVVLKPGAKYTVSMALPQGRDASQIVSIRAQPSVIIFADDTAAGNEEEIVYLFRLRAINQRFWQFMDKALTDIPAAGDALAYLQALEREMNSLTEEDLRKSLAFQEIRGRITQVIERPTHFDAAQQIGRLVQEVRSRREAADAHSQRRQSVGK